MTPRVGTGALGEKVELRQQLASEIDYDRPRKGGGAIFDLIGDFRGRTVLDVGCGLGVFREHVERIGAAWIGMDLFGSCCSVLGDVDHLPFRDGTFDGILCSAVLEHMPNPFRTVLEMRRVLKDGGKLFGYVAFLEPFHGLSYYHMSHKGLEHLLASNGFRPLHIFPALNGTAFQLESMLFPKYVPLIQPMFRFISQWLFRTALLMNRILRGLLRGARGKFGAADRQNRQMYRLLLRLRFASGFNFVAERCEDIPECRSEYLDLVR